MTRPLTPTDLLLAKRLAATFLEASGILEVVLNNDSEVVLSPGSIGVAGACHLEHELHRAGMQMTAFADSLRKRFIKAAEQAHEAASASSKQIAVLAFEDVTEGDCLTYRSPKRQQDRTGQVKRVHPRKRTLDVMPAGGKRPETITWPDVRKAWRVS